MGGHQVGVERPKGSQGVDLQQSAGVNNPLYVTAPPAAPMAVDVTDRWARLLGQVDIARANGAAMAAANPVIAGIYDAAGNRMPSMDAVARPGFVDPIDRAARLLGIAYGNLAQLQQRVGTLELRTVDSNIPRGGIIDSGSVNTLVGYQTVTTYVVSNLTTFNLARMVVSAPKASMVIIRWNGAQIGLARTLADQSILIEHFPANWYPMVGDGVKAVDIQAKWDVTTSLVEAEIDGEEV